VFSSEVSSALPRSGGRDRTADTAIMSRLLYH
jgi:hypothetical protein